MYEPDLALNNLKWFICHQAQLNQILHNMYVWTGVGKPNPTQPNQTQPNQTKPK